MARLCIKMYWLRRAVFLLPVLILLQAQAVFATLHADDDKAYKENGTIRNRLTHADPKLQYMSRLDYTRFIESALTDSQQAIASAPSLNAFDMRRT